MRARGKDPRTRNTRFSLRVEALECREVPSAAGLLHSLQHLLHAEVSERSAFTRSVDPPGVGTVSLASPTRSATPADSQQSPAADPVISGQGTQTGTPVFTPATLVTPAGQASQSPTSPTSQASIATALAAPSTTTTTQGTAPVASTPAGPTASVNTGTTTGGTRMVVTVGFVGAFGPEGVIEVAAGPVGAPQAPTVVSTSAPTVTPGAVPRSDAALLSGGSSGEEFGVADSAAPADGPAKLAPLPEGAIRPLLDQTGQTIDGVRHFLGGFGPLSWAPNRSADVAVADVAPVPEAATVRPVLDQADHSAEGVTRVLGGFGALTGAPELSAAAAGLLLWQWRTAAEQEEWRKRLARPRRR